MYYEYNTTLHAPAERVEDNKLESQSKCFAENQLISSLLNAVDIFILILNKHRQIVYANESFTKALALENHDNLIGKRPGEAIGCIHSEEHQLGCGASEACRCCNAVNLVLKSIKNGDKYSDEVVITYKDRNFELPINMMEYVTPFQYGDESFYIVSMIDISDSQRRRMLERLFFHDILNTSGALKGLVGMLKEDVPLEFRPEVEFVEDAFESMVEDIVEQRMIIQAENDDLEIETITVDSEEIIKHLLKLYKSHQEAFEKSLFLSDQSENVIIKTDYVLLKRVLGNMIKNALEAERAPDAIEIGSRKCKDDGYYIEFWVWNSGYIPREAQLQIFQRSFSTKGKNRGIGTYSMKLFGEKYLKGKVGFETSEVDGTKFYLRLKKE